MTVTLTLVIRPKLLCVTNRLTLVELSVKFLFKGLLHCFSTCIEITGGNWYCFIINNVENCKKKIKRAKKL